MSTKYQLTPAAAKRIAKALTEKWLAGDGMSARYTDVIQALRDENFAKPHTVAPHLLVEIEEDFPMVAVYIGRLACEHAAQQHAELDRIREGFRLLGLTREDNS